MDQRRKPEGGDLAGNLRDPDRPAELVGGFAPGDDSAEIGQRAFDHEPGFLRRPA